MTAVADDSQLIEQIRRGDLTAFEALYNKYKSQVYRTALAITDDAAAAEDLLQECFLRLHANIDRLDGSTPLAPWLHRVTVNLAYNFVTRRKRSLGALEALWENFAVKANTSPERAIEHSELRRLVEEALEELSFEHRAVVILFYLSEFSIEEIAYIMNCPVGTVKSRLHYARHKLRARLLDTAEPGYEALYGLAGSTA